MNDQWMLYGANGFTGRWILELAKAQGLKPVIAGRNEKEIKQLAADFQLDYRVFSLKDEGALLEGLKGMKAILLAAGPFSKTSPPVLEACLKTQTHYLDITGEISVFEACFRKSTEAYQKGIVVLPGVGFDVVPTDTLSVALKQKFPEAESLELAFTVTGSGASRGTMETMLENFHHGAIRENGIIKEVPFASQIKEIPFPDGLKKAVCIPWGDVSTAYYSTGIPNISVYASFPLKSLALISTLKPLMGLLKFSLLQGIFKKGLLTFNQVPDRNLVKEEKIHIFGKVTSSKGESLVGSAMTPNGYAFTAASSLEIMKRILKYNYRPGTYTPAMLFGPDLLNELLGMNLKIHI